MTQRKGETLRDIERDDVDVRVVVSAEPLKGFFGLGTGGYDVKVFCWGDQVGVKGGRVVDCDGYAGEEAYVGVLREGF